MQFKNKLYIILIIFMVLASLQVISASDLNETTFISGEETDYTIDFEVDDVDYGEDVTVDVTCPDDSDGNLSFNVRNGNEIVFSEVQKPVDGSATFIISNLNGGTYTLGCELVNDTIYKNKLFYESNAFTVYPIDTTITATADPIFVGGDAVIDIVMREDVTGQIDVVLDGEVVSADLKNGSAQITIPNLGNGTYNASVEYEGDDNFNPQSAWAKIEVFKISEYNINITVPEDITAGEDISVEFGLPSDINGNVTVLYDNISQSASVVNGIAFINISNIVKGNHTIEVVFSENNKYTTKSNNTAIYAVAVEPAIDVLNKSVAQGDNFIIILDGDAVGNVTVNFNGVSVTSPISDGKAVISTAKVPAGVYDAKITYTGDDKYGAGETTQRLNVQTVEYTIGIITNDIIVGDVENINFILPEDLSDVLIVRVDGKNYTVNVNKGKGSLNVSGLNYGYFDVLAAFNGNAKYLPQSNTTTFKVSVKTPVNVNISEVIRGYDIVVEFPEDASGNVTLNVGNNSITVPVSGGKAVIPTDSINPGNYTAEYTYRGDDKYSSYNNTSSLVVISRVIINAENMVKYYSNTSRFRVVLTNTEGQILSNHPIKLTINGVTYNKETNANGLVTIPASLNSGNYTVSVSAGNAQANFTVTILSTVNGTDIVKVFRNATQYSATFRNADGSYLASGTVVQFNINGVFYNRTVSQNGLAKLNINLPQGEYVITATNLLTGENYANNITVLPTIINNHDLTKYYKNASQYSVQLVGLDGKVVGEGVYARFNINGMYYERTTNAEGIAKLNINLGPGTYVVTTDYLGCHVSNKITVLPTLSGSDLTKRSGESGAYRVTLVDGKGNPRSSVAVNFNINGVLYTRTTNSNGIASLNINLPVGSYTVTAVCGDATCSNTIRVN